MIKQKLLNICIVAVLGLSANAAAQAAVHGMVLKPSSLKQPVVALFGTESTDAKPLPANVDLTLRFPHVFPR
ncbi:hypothetical protein XpopCFBP1817_20770 [Xanthomonas populi]|uniref:Uncharacterized protein n=1 Tax=Xanthomonas populi TaxID=53414 RepID=A0A2S7DYV4_9XANT|nr:hypothetical protein XpopCFBP1817_20770 [Xanthomonas populi]